MMRLINADCLEAMRDIPDGSVDMVLTDPPYGTTACKWDSVIPFAPMWEQLKRITKPNGAIVLTASQPFTSALIMSNVKMFKYCWVWDKVRKTGHLNAKHQPMRRTEDVAIFYKSRPCYNPQMVNGAEHLRGPFGKRKEKTAVYGNFSDDNRTYISSEYYPENVIKFCAEMKSIHPTQKPVALMEYLIRTYTNAGDTVLDFTFGSGTTGVAAKNLGRSFIGIELDPDYFALGSKRIADTPECAA
jgi:site-specific DNA-methyltransferase (adenine-specific)